MVKNGHKLRKTLGPFSAGDQKRVAHWRSWSTLPTCYRFDEKLKYLNLAEGVADAPALVSSWGEDEVGDDHHHLHDDNDDDCDDDDDDDDDDTYRC